MKDFPKHFQAEVDTMALGIRKENVILIDKLKSQRKHIDSELYQFDIEGHALEHSNSDLFAEKDLSDELVAKLVGGLNQRMSLKAQTQIQVNKTMEEIGKVIEQTEGLPEQLEMLAINLGGDIEECKFSIRESLLESEQVSVLIVETGEEIVGIKRASDLLQEQVKEHDRSIKKGNAVQEERLTRILKESDAHSRVASEKRIIHSDKERSRNIAQHAQNTTSNSDNLEIANWEDKISEVQNKIKQAKSEMKQSMIEMYDCKHREHEMKSLISNQEGDMKDLSNSLENHNIAVLKERNVVDDLTDQRIYRNEKLKKSIEEAKIAKQLLEEELERALKKYVTQKEARCKIVAAWTDCDNGITVTKKELVAFKTDQNKISTKLEAESQHLSQLVNANSFQLNELKDCKLKTHLKLKNDTEMFERDEMKMRNALADIKATLESNINTLSDLTEILSKRQPIYQAHQVEADENETLYEAVKFKLVQAQNRESDIKATINRTKATTQTLQRKFKHKKTEKDLALDETKKIIHTNSKIINELDCTNYELLVEWEQYHKENDRIGTFKKASRDHIIDMRHCDVKISVQLVQYVGILKTLQNELDQYRVVFNDFCNKSDRDGDNILYSITTFEDETKRRYNVINFVQQQLNSMAEHFESYVNVVEEKRPKTTQPKHTRKKRRFRVEVPLDARMLRDVSKFEKSRNGHGDIIIKY